MTYDDAVVEIATKARLLPTDLDDLHAASLDDARDGGQRVAMIVQNIRDAGRDPGQTGWQEAAAILNLVTDGAAKVAPLLGVFSALAAL